ncbi:MBL fold metallo-hydrolase [archaeon]|nr:MBL fold metallo-hydrolase [archaeon]
MEITKFEQSCIFIKSGGVFLLADAGKYSFPAGAPDYCEFSKRFPNVNVCVVTHAHADHYELGFLKKLYEDCRTPFFFSTESVLREAQMENLFGMSDTLKPGERVELAEGVFIEGVEARHGGENVDGFGFVLDDGETRVYHCGDTLEIASPPQADVVLVPIDNRGNVFSPAEAAAFINKVKPKIAIPMHYDSPKSERRPEDFVKEMGGSSVRVVVLKPGETLKAQI